MRLPLGPFAILFLVGCGGSASPAGSTTPPETPDAAVPDVYVPNYGSNDAPDATPAPVDAGPPMALCQDLSNVGTGDFVYERGGRAPKLNADIEIARQGTSCGGGPYWEMQLRTDGKVLLDLSDGTIRCHLESSASAAAVNDGNMHEVEMLRLNGTLTLSIDGRNAAMPCAVSFGKLAPLSYLVDPCVDGGTDFGVPPPFTLDAGECGYP
jgi:hypothetical protein